MTDDEGGWNASEKQPRPDHIRAMREADEAFAALREWNRRQEVLREIADMNFSDRLERILPLVLARFAADRETGERRVGLVAALRVLMASGENEDKG